MTALVIGSSLSPETSFSPTALPGGTLESAAIALAALGRQVRFVTDLGTNSAAQRAARTLQNSGVELLLRPAAQRPEVTVPDSTEHELNGAWDILPAPENGARLLDLELFSPKTVVFGGSAVHIRPGRERLRAWVEAGRRSGVSLFTLSVRPALVGNLAHARDRVEAFLPLADVVRASAADVTALWGLRGGDNVYNDVARHMFTFGPQIIAMSTPDSSLIMYSREGTSVKIPAQSSLANQPGHEEGVITAALADGLGRVSLSGAHHREQLGNISLSNLYTLGAFAQAAGAFTASHRDAIAPSQDQVAESYLRHAPGLLTLI